MSQTAAVENLLQAIRSYDSGLLEHSLGVANLALHLSSLLGMERDGALNLLLPGALLHDVGKIQISKAILQKPGPLSPQEWELMRRHPEYGARMLAKRKLNGQLQEIVLYHHERWDGKGYLGVEGNEIPLLAQIVALADAIQAMTTDRPYRKALSPLRVYKEITTCSGSQFSPRLISALERSGFWPEATGEKAIMACLLAREKQWLAHLVEMFNSLQHPLVQAQSKKIDRLVTAYYKDWRGGEKGE